MVVAVATLVEHDFLCRGINLLHFAQEYLHIRCVPHHLPQGGRHISLGDQSRRHLVEQGLEQVEVALVDQGDAHGFADQRMAGLQTTKTTAHNHHMGEGLQAFHRWIELQEEAFAGHG